MPVPCGTQITIRIPDDFHHHCRDGIQTSTIVNHASKRFGRCLIMPNLKPPITTTEMALEYKQHLLRSFNNTVDGEESSSTTTTTVFEPLMTLYLTESMQPEEIYKAADIGKGQIVGCKYYPAGATTNSEHGVSDIKKCYPTIQALAECNMMLCIHSEVTHGDIFDREKIFIDEIMKPLVRDFPTLKITMEHISTKEAVDYVLNEAPDTVKASVTCHHLLYNRNDLLVGGIKPHLYCLPILKGNDHCLALRTAVTNGTSTKLFAGTDSAPHVTYTKESACGCAGVYTAHAALELYTEVFDMCDKLQHLENFVSSYGADHYNIPRSTKTITLEKKAWTVPNTYQFGTGPNETVTPLRAGQEVRWTIIEK